MEGTDEPSIVRIHPRFKEALRFYQEEEAVQPQVFWSTQNEL
jgi:hypothetical protein